jgi:hypothetical protein
MLTVHVTLNTLPLLSKDQHVNSNYGNNRCFHENYNEHINTPCGQNSVLKNVKEFGKHIYRCAFGCRLL